MIYLLALLSGLVGRLALRFGRRGGTFLVVAGLLSGLSGAWLLVGLPFGVRLPAALLGAAPAMLGIGLLVRVGPTASRRASSDAELTRALEQHRPLRLCLDCRIEVDGARCPGCRKSSSCFDVKSEADRQNARALLGLNP